MVLGGILVGPYVLDLLLPELMAISGEIRLLALVIILLRAGLGLSKDILKKIGFTALKMSALPGLLEGFTILYISHAYMGLSLVEAGMLGFIIAAVSPAVVVPSMLELKEKGYGMKKNIPLLILAGASVDDVFAITMFSMFLGLGTGSGGGGFLKIAAIPLEILGGLALGLIVGFILLYIIQKYDVNVTEETLLILGSATAVTLAGEALGLAGLLGVMALGFLFLDRGEQQKIAKLERNLGQLWVAAQLFLFILIGAAVNLPVALESGLKGLILITFGLTARSLGVFIATMGAGLSKKERLFCAIAYTPKATVQAAVGGIPLLMGVAAGEFILAVAVLAILITAPFGAIAIKLGAGPLLRE